MGRKSSSKGQGRSPSSSPPPVPDSARTRWLVVAVIAVLVVGAAAAYMTSVRQPDAAASAASPQPDAAAQTSQAVVGPLTAKFGPRQQANLPPLPLSPSPPARSPDVVNAAYKFAAEHPEVLSYVPCYCGCERSGHRGNDDCFVSARAANGD